MKKVVLILAAAAAVAACAKNEVITDFANGEDEITFNVAPKTKALGTNQEDFNTDNVFTASAYYLPAGKDWTSNEEAAQLYIDGSLISFNGTVWKNETTPYYWPKDGGKLTFFAFSYNKGNMTLSQAGQTSHFTIEKPQLVNGELHYGVNGAIDVVANKNVDFLVADIAADKTGNTETYAHNGVPTLFKHKLSQVLFTAKTKEDYTAAGKTFEINEITFVALPFYGMYNQYPETMTVGTGDVKTADQSYTKGIAQAVTKDAANVAATDGAEAGQILYVPQTFTDTEKTVVVKYTIKTKVGDETIVENLEAPVKISGKFGAWEMGKRYIFNLVFGLNEITWDPAVENWTDVSSTGITIE